MHADIARFIDTALTKMDLQGIEGIDLKGVFSLAELVGHDLGMSGRLGAQYLAVDPIVWMEAGGDPFWPVDHIGTRTLNESTHICSNMFTFLIREECRENRLIDQTLSSVLSDKAMDMIISHMGINLSLSMDQQLHGWNSRFRFIDFLKSRVQQGFDLRFDTVISKANMYISIDKLSSLFEKHTQELFEAHAKDDQFFHLLGSQLGHFDHSSSMELFRKCVEVLGEEKGRSLARLMHSNEDGLGLSRKFMLDKTLERFWINEPDKVMKELKALDCTGLGDDYVGKWLNKRISVIDFFYELNNTYLGASFWLDFAINQIGKDQNINSQAWPATFLLKVMEESPKAHIEYKEKIEFASDVLNIFVRDNPETFKLMVRDKLKEQTLKDAISAVSHNWPVNIECLDEAYEEIADHGVYMIAAPKIDKGFLGDGNQLIAGLLNEYPCHSVFNKMGKRIYNISQCNEFTTRGSSLNGAAACVALYIRSMEIKPKEEMSKCLEISDWTFSKAVLARLDIPKHLYRNLNPQQRGDMLETDLGL